MEVVPNLRLAAWRTFRHFLQHAIVAAICIVTAVPAGAQLLPAVPIASPGSIPGLRSQGLYETAPILIDGAPVFRVAALANPPPDAMPIASRVLLVQNAVAQALALDPDRNGTVYDPETLHVGVSRVGAQYELTVTDARHSDGVTIVTVTTNDAQAAGMTERDLANQWRDALESALRSAVHKRQPGNIRENTTLVLRGFMALAILTIVIAVIRFTLQRRGRALQQMVDERQLKLERERDDTNPRRNLALALRAAGPEARLNRVNAIASGLLWLVVLAWFAGVTYALLLFPQTTSTGQYIVQAAWRIAVIWIVAGVVDRGLQVVIAHFAQVYALRGGSSEERARHALRAPTITNALGGAKTSLILFIAVLATLGQLDIPIASVVTIGGIAALAVGFAAQSLVRDMLNGMLVLLEDQYVVGDYIFIGDYNGIVENLTLRVVQLRDMRGRLITIPHSAAVQVVNTSRNWSRVDYRVAIDPAADCVEAIALVRKTLESFADEDAWRDAVLDPVEWIGVESIGKAGVVLRASVKTAPLRQFELRRAINERVMSAFAQAGIELGNDPLGPPVPAPQASPNPT